MYTSRTGLILGFHGTDESIVTDVLNGKAELKEKENDYDWLGHGIYFWDNITSHYWTPATFLDDPSSLTPVTTPTDDIAYTLNVVSQTCGTATSTVFVRVYKKITIPNTFSPNNDGINDYWNIEALFTYPESITQVFDRYGRQVFQSTGYAQPWDGANNGKPLPAGTYYYIIDLKNGQPKLSGWVLMVR